MRVHSPPPPLFKRRRFSGTRHSMDADAAKAKLKAAKQKFGREIHVFETSIASVKPKEELDGNETDDFYEFTAEDYYRILATRKEDKYLKTRKIREAEEAARRSRVTKVVIRVRFPDNYTLEANFHPSETIQSLVDLLVKVIARPELPFYIYTTPPKKPIKDLAQNFFSAGFVPGAIVYFSYDSPKGDDGTIASSGPFLNEEILSLKGLELIPDQPEPKQPSPEPVAPESQSPVVQERKPADKKVIKPKWLKM